MIHKAVVLDNSLFYERGVIRVRVAGYFLRNLNFNLEEDFPNSIEEGQEDDFSQDFEAFLTSPLGGGRNYGIFMLPQVNEVGLVAFLGRNQRKPVWLGSIFEPHHDDNFDVTYTNIPSDLPEQEGENTDGMLDGSHNMRAEEEGDQLNKNIVIRTKNTNPDSQEEIDWQQQRTTNIIVVSDKEIRARHFTPEEGWDETTPQKWQEILLSKNKEDKDSIQAEVHNAADSKIGRMYLTEDGFNIELDNDGDVNTFKLANNEDGVNFYFEDKDGSIIELNSEDGIKFTTENDITMDVSGKVKVAGAGDSVVLYSELKKLIEYVEKHIHQTPAGPTVGDPLNPDMSPLFSKTTQPKNNMQSQKVDTD